ncbi:hypothetical protein ACLOJK_030996 [Asimina triloba]
MNLQTRCLIISVSDYRAKAFRKQVPVLRMQAVDAHLLAIMGKPLLFTKFGKSSKDPGFSGYQRNTLINTVYSKIYSSPSTGGPAGRLFW